MKLILREMKPDEANTIQSLGIMCFLRSMEGFYVPKPKTARIAEVDGKIVGGFIYNIETSRKKKFGIIDFFFVDPKYAGQGIGSVRVFRWSKTLCAIMVAASVFVVFFL